MIHFASSVNEEETHYSMQAQQAGDSYIQSRKRSMCLFAAAAIVLVGSSLFKTASPAVIL